MSAGETDEILLTRQGALGLATLNRPAALNALTDNMCISLHEALRRWREAPGVASVAVRSEHEKAFCAGGDIVALTRSAKAGTDDWQRFFAHEYRLNVAIKEYEKPYVAFIGGITMGGGVGISVHGRYRVASERTVFAMPETGIGFYPDVGGSHFLPRLPGATGLYLGLTGARLKAADLYALGLATHVVPQDRLSALIDALADTPTNAVPALLDEAHQDPGPAPLDQYHALIDRHFGQSSVTDILASLASDDGDWAQITLSTLKTKSPLMLAVTFEGLTRGKALSFREVMAMEYRIAAFTLLGTEFHEGVRALLIDKDNAPRWRHGDVSEVSAEEVAAAFAPPPGGDLTFGDTDTPATGRIEG